MPSSLSANPKEFFLATQALASVEKPAVHLLRYIVAEQFYRGLVQEIETGEFTIAREQMLRYGSQTLADDVRYRFDTMKYPGDIDLISVGGAPIKDFTRLCGWFAGANTDMLQFGYGAPETSALKRFKKHQHYTRCGEHHIAMVLPFRAQAVADMFKGHDLPAHIRLHAHDKEILADLITRDSAGNAVFRQEIVDSVNTLYENALSSVSSDMATRIKATPNGIPLAFNIELRVNAPSPLLPVIDDKAQVNLPRIHPATELAQKFFALAEARKIDDKYAASLIDFHLRKAKLSQSRGMAYDTFQRSLTALLVAILPAQPQYHVSPDYFPQRNWENIARQLVLPAAKLATTPTTYTVGAMGDVMDTVMVDKLEEALHEFRILYQEMARLARVKSGFPEMGDAPKEKDWKRTRPEIYSHTRRCAQYLAGLREGRADFEKDAGALLSAIVPLVARVPGSAAIAPADFSERLKQHIGHAKTVAAALQKGETPGL